MSATLTPPPETVARPISAPAPGSRSDEGTPVLPVALSAGVTGGRRRPLGVVIGLALSFTFATVALVYLIDALGLPDDLVRTLAIVVLLGFGLALLIPPLGARLEAALSRLVPAAARRPAGSGEGFGSGLVLGLSLGAGWITSWWCSWCWGCRCPACW